MYACMCVYIWIQIYTIEYYSGLKNNEIMPFVTTWMGSKKEAIACFSETKFRTIGLVYLWNHRAGKGGILTRSLDK